VRDPPPRRSGLGGLGGWMRLKMGYGGDERQNVAGMESEAACILYWVTVFWLG
jgi:hypothetical protein